MRTIQSELVEKGFTSDKKQTKRRKSRSKENLSEREIRELMGAPTYRRGKGGAMRQVRKG